jgi:D-alanyl-D-alanine carboxypeptidase/D-alanyl-D-alanine-endopeptidase (penicillin-binding protein 4)
MVARSRLLTMVVAGALVVAGLSGSAAAEPTGQAALAADLDRILGDARLFGAQPGVVVRDAVTGETLYDRGGAGRLLPASNNKIFASIGALEALGPDYRFTTSVLASGAQQGSALLGDLYLRGGGDPTMLASDYDGLAAQVAAAGVGVVTGRLVADDSWFDDVRLGVSWAWDDEPYYYSAQVSALTVAPDTDYDAGTVIVRVAPGAAAGAGTVVTLTPATGYVHIDNRATTGAPGSAETISVERAHGSNTIVVSGSVPAGAASTQDWASVWEPAGYAADVFRAALAAHGVQVLGDTARGVTPTGARQLAQHDSMTLAQLLVPFLKLSNNGHAEVLVKAVGRATRGLGTGSAGIATIRQRLAALGVPAGGYRLVDGSGLSRMDMITPDGISTLLLAARSRPWFDAWYAALPIAGQPDRFVGGTLRNRMRNTPAAGNVHAKTGSLTGVTALSGYVTAASGEPLVFSVVLNNYVSSSPKDIEDAIAIRLASYQGDADQLDAAATSLPELRLPADDPLTAPDESALECTWSHAC